VLTAYGTPPARVQVGAGFLTGGGTEHTGGGSAFTPDRRAPTARHRRLGMLDWSAHPCRRGVAPRIAAGLYGRRRILRVMAELHDATEEYLETILEIEEEGIPPIRARLVERLGISAPAVSETVNRLVEQGYAVLLDDRTLRLTAKGRELAVSIVRRHRLAERLLTDVIGLEWEKVHREADRWEHAISADVEEKLVALLGDPGTCPHGNPIPGSKHRVDARGAVSLARAQAGPVRVTRISEKLELDDEALTFLAAAQLIPGSEVVVAGPAPGGVAVKSGSGEHTVPTRLAELMWVSPA
jgi:DtxR family transcriptional regulator, iron-dependent repressor